MKYYVRIILASIMDISQFERIFSTADDVLKVMNRCDVDWDSHFDIVELELLAKGEVISFEVFEANALIMVDIMRAPDLKYAKGKLLQRQLAKSSIINTINN